MSQPQQIQVRLHPLTVTSVEPKGEPTISLSVSVCRMLGFLENAEVVARNRPADRYFSARLHFGREGEVHITGVADPSFAPHDTLEVIAHGLNPWPMTDVAGILECLCEENQIIEIRRRFKAAPQVNWLYFTD